MNTTMTPRQQRSILFAERHQDALCELVLVPEIGEQITGTARELRNKLFVIDEQDAPSPFRLILAMTTHEVQARSRREFEAVKAEATRKFFSQETTT